MKIQIFSDLHLEFADYTPAIDPLVDVVVFAGDIHVKGRAVQWLEDIHSQCKRSPYFIYIAGNHESYSGAIPKTYQKIESEINNDKIVFLENRSVVINSVKFIGATLWTDLSLTTNKNIAHGILRTFMNDYRKIRLNKLGYRKLQPEDTYRFHQESLDYIKGELSGSSERKNVVVTHHAPSSESLNPAGDKVLAAAYASHLDYLFDPVAFSNPPQVWIHGHTHTSCSYHVGDTHIVSNPRGYAGIEPNDDFKDVFVIEI